MKVYAGHSNKIPINFLHVSAWNYQPTYILLTRVPRTGCPCSIFQLPDRSTLVRVLADINSR